VLDSSIEYALSGFLLTLVVCKLLWGTYPID
jgi:hypothetical protein